MQPLRAWRLLASLYSTQFLGLMFFVVAMAAILRERGASLDTIGLVYLLGMVWPLKALWAPWIDRYAIGRRGHYRGWLLLTQGGMVLCLALIGVLDLQADFTSIYLLCLATSLLSATQDIAVDGLACRLLTPADRGFGNGLQIGGGLVGNLVGGGAMLMLYPTIGWMGCCLALAALTSVSWLQLLRYQEPTWPRPAQPGGYSRLIGFWRGPGRMRLLLLLLIYPAGSALAYSIVMPALVDAGWTLESIGLIVNVLGSLAGLAAALAYGRLLRRYSRRRAMVAAALLQWLGIAGLALPAMGWGGSVVAGAAVVAYFLLYNPAATVLATLMMDQSSQASPATDYTLQVSLSQCFVMVLTSAGAMLAGRTGYGGVIGVAVILALLAAIASLRWTPKAGA